MIPFDFHKLSTIEQTVPLVNKLPLICSRFIEFFCSLFFNSMLALSRLTLYTLHVQFRALAIHTFGHTPGREITYTGLGLHVARHRQMSGHKFFERHAHAVWKAANSLWIGPNDIDFDENLVSTVDNIFMLLLVIFYCTVIHSKDSYSFVAFSWLSKCAPYVVPVYNMKKGSNIQTVLCSICIHEYSWHNLKYTCICQRRRMRTKLLAYVLLFVYFFRP